MYQILIKKLRTAQPDEKTKKQKVEEAKKAFEPGRFKQILKNLRRKLQNSQAYIQAWQDELERAKLISGWCCKKGLTISLTRITLNRGLGLI